MRISRSMSLVLALLAVLIGTVAGSWLGSRSDSPPEHAPEPIQTVSYSVSGGLAGGVFSVSLNHRGELRLTQNGRSHQARLSAERTRQLLRWAAAADFSQRWRDPGCCDIPSRQLRIDGQRLESEAAPLLVEHLKHEAQRHGFAAR